jgi:hypothetical protein
VGHLEYLWVCLSVQDFLIRSSCVKAIADDGFLPHALTSSTALKTSALTLIPRPHYSGTPVIQHPATMNTPLTWHIFPPKTIFLLISSHLLSKPRSSSSQANTRNRSLKTNSTTSEKLLQCLLHSNALPKKREQNP